jgi:crotonobetainyl-CoA:carnitine CoA-transferase CaiB-like acyl-CoA transferase
MAKIPSAEWFREKDDPKVSHTKLEALDDITVLDLSCNSFAGSYCTSLLAEFGAEVIRIEPSEGDFLRTCTPYGITHKGEGLNYRLRKKQVMSLNPRKGSKEILMFGHGCPPGNVCDRPNGSVGAWV